MRPCQLCGATSWGAVNKSLELQGLSEWLDVGQWGKDVTAFVRCDNCKTIARRSLVETQETDHRNDPGPFDVLGQVFTSVSGAIPQSEARTERLVRALLSNGFCGLPPSQDAANIVRFVRAVEDELDKPTEYSFASIRWMGFDGSDTTIQPYVRSFPTTAELAEWLLHGLGQARERVGNEDLPRDININRLTHYFIDWLARGAPTE